VIKNIGRKGSARIITPVLFTILLTLLSAGKSYADGMGTLRSVGSTHLAGAPVRYVDEDSQYALIAHENGLEVMILGINVNYDPEDDLLWIFPVPSKPEDIVIDIYPDIPAIYGGRDVNEAASTSLQGIGELMLASQIYPNIFTGFRDEGWGHRASGTSRSTGSTVLVFEYIEKEGMTSEIITATDADAMFNYFFEKGFDIQSGMIPILDSYIGQNYSFVCSWVPGSDQSEQNKRDFLQFHFDNLVNFPELMAFLNLQAELYPEFGEIMGVQKKIEYILSPDGQPIFSSLADFIDRDPAFISYSQFSDYQTEFDRKNKAVMVTFPTERIYFPLKLTSVYKSEIVPASIYIIGSVEPELFGFLGNYADVSYRVGGNLYLPEEIALPSFITSDTQNIDYTSIFLRAPSSYYADDLWMSRGIPYRARLAKFIALSPYVISALLYAICSLLAAIIAGYLIFRKKEIRFGTLAVIGVANCVSIVGPIIAIFNSRIGSLSVSDSQAPDRHKLADFYTRKITALVVLIIYLVIIFFEFYYRPEVMGLYGYPIQDILMLVILIPLIIMLFRTNAAERKLLDEMKEIHQSIVPRNIIANKIIFIILFSLLFLGFTQGILFVLGKFIA
jgi:hypothetical protein